MQPANFEIVFGTLQKDALSEKIVARLLDLIREKQLRAARAMRAHLDHDEAKLKADGKKARR
jgi:hypothetical protein